MNRKILIPLATLLAAGAIAVGSGATFDSHTGNTISSVTSGTLLHTNSKNNAAIFTLTNMKPGDTLNGTLTLKNTGTLPAAFSLTEVSSSNGFAGSNLTLDIVDTTTSATVYSGPFGGLVGTLLIGLLASGDVGVFYGGDFSQLGKQAVAAGAVLAYSFVLTYIIGKLIDVTIGFRISEEDEVLGIDQVEHLETAYDHAGGGGSNLLKEL